MHKNQLINNTPPPPSTGYAVSVIIPLYNAEEYVGECLDSVFMQTFQDFEVIVVDDCSTDNSVKVVKSYASKFGRRLKLAQTKKNFGGGGYVPRNIGLSLASGEYVWFIDADDFILLTALENLYNTAKEYNTDAIYTRAHYKIKNPQDVVLVKDQDTIRSLTCDIELTTNDTDKILKKVLLKAYHRTPWAYFVRRDLLLNNKIGFPQIISGGDNLWVMLVCAHAKRFLRLPNSLYFYRAYHGSNTRNEANSPEEKIAGWVSRFAFWLRSFYRIKNSVPFMIQNPEICFEAIRGYFDFSIKMSTQKFMDLQSHDIHEMLYKNFAAQDISPFWLMPFLFGLGYEQKNNLQEQQDLVERFKSYLIARLDIKLTAEGSLEVISVSDEEAAVKQPPFIQKGGTGHVISSFAGELKVVLKPSVNGKMRLWLRGADVRDPKDKSKRIPYWIDFTTFTVNEQPVLNEITSVWHDKPYAYNLNAKAGEEIRIYLEWLPHLKAVDTLKEISAAQSQEVDKLKVVSATRLQEVDKLKEMLILQSREMNKLQELKRVLTARIDLKLMGAGDIQIISVSDDKVEITRPTFIQSGGSGYVLK